MNANNQFFSPLHTQFTVRKQYPGGVIVNNSFKMIGQKIVALVVCAMCILQFGWHIVCTRTRNCSCCYRTIRDGRYIEESSFSFIVEWFCFACRVKDSRKVLKVIRALPVGILDSKEISGNLYSEEMELGGKWDVWSLKSKLTGLPKNLVGDLTATIFGNRIPLVSGGIESRGLETILRRLLGPYGLLKDIIQSRMSLYDLLRPLSSQHFGIMAEKIREFIGRVNVFLIAIFSHFVS